LSNLTEKFKAELCAALFVFLRWAAWTVDWDQLRNANRSFAIFISTFQSSASPIT